MHPLYPVALRLVGKPVYAHHVTGRVYHGLLHSVTYTGIYMMPYGSRARLVSAAGDDLRTSWAAGVKAEGDADLVFAPLAFFGFGALAGLGLGLAAGAPYYWW
jgi:hypothetical protein